jgi:hypothetical protein
MQPPLVTARVNEDTQTASENDEGNIRLEMSTKAAIHVIRQRVVRYPHQLPRFSFAPTHAAQCAIFAVSESSPKRKGRESAER